MSIALPQWSGPATGSPFSGRELGIRKENHKHEKMRQLRKETPGTDSYRDTLADIDNLNRLLSRWKLEDACLAAIVNSWLLDGALHELVGLPQWHATDGITSNWCAQCSQDDKRIEQYLQDHPALRDQISELETRGGPGGVNATTEETWQHWKYAAPFGRALSYIQFFFGATNEYHDFIVRTEQMRTTELELIARVNAGLLKHVTLFTITPIDGGANAAEKVPQTLQDLLARQRQLGNTGLLPAEILELNRLLLEQIAPDAIRSRSEIRRVTIHDKDQSHRALFAVIGWGIFIVSCVLIDPNRSSLHSYYRDRLRTAYLEEGDDSQSGVSRPLAELTPHSWGGPYPLIGASVSEYNPLVRTTQLEAPFSPYLLSPLFCGSATFGMAETRALATEELTVADAMAISGAAITPGSFVHHIVYLAMSILNLRTGKWLPVRAERTATEQAGWRHLLENFRRHTFTNVRRRKLSQAGEVELTGSVLVADGGQTDNLGLGVLLDRKCRLIVVSDVGEDAGFECTDLARIVREYRRDRGIDFEELTSGRAFDPRSQILWTSDSDAGAVARKHFAVARIMYPHNQSGYLIYIKPAMTGDEQFDLQNYRNLTPLFPHESTTDQAFTEAQCESYRAVGFHTGLCVCEEADDLWSAREFDVNTLLDRLMLGLGDRLDVSAELLENLLKLSDSQDEDEAGHARNQLEALPLGRCEDLSPLYKRLQADSDTHSDSWTYAKSILADGFEDIVQNRMRNVETGAEKKQLAAAVELRHVLSADIGTVDTQELWRFFDEPCPPVDVRIEILNGVAGLVRTSRCIWNDADAERLDRIHKHDGAAGVRELAGQLLEEISHLAKGDT